MKDPLKSRLTEMSPIAKRVVIGVSMILLVMALPVIGLALLCIILTMLNHSTALLLIIVSATIIIRWRKSSRK